jgi:glycosyltransferase involved in cell wall biosynthesis
MTGAHQNRPQEISVGLPVYNGGSFLDETIASIVGQTFSSLELIISDNASTDRTREIAQSWVARDDRVRYVCNEFNIGANANFNQVLRLARGRYHKWAAADDLCRPDFLARCKEVLDRRQDVVLAYCQTEFIDETGARLPLSDPGFDLQQDSARARIAYVFRADHWVNAVLGVIRIDALRGTSGLPPYPTGDYTLLAELAAQGKFVEIPEPLYLRRIHPEASSQLAGDPEAVTRLVAGTVSRLPIAVWRRHKDAVRISWSSRLSIWDRLILIWVALDSLIARRKLLVEEFRAYWRHWRATTRVAHRS